MNSVSIWWYWWVMSSPVMLFRAHWVKKSIVMTEWVTMSLQQRKGIFVNSTVVGFYWYLNILNFSTNFTLLRKSRFWGCFMTFHKSEMFICNLSIGSLYIVILHSYYPETRDRCSCTFKYLLEFRSWTLPSLHLDKTHPYIQVLAWI